MDDHRPDVPRNIPEWLGYVALVALLVIVVISFSVLFSPQGRVTFSRPNYAIPYPYVTDTPAPYSTLYP